MWIALAVFAGFIAIVVGAYEMFVVRHERAIVERLAPKETVVRPRVLKPEETIETPGLPRQLRARLQPIVGPSRLYLAQSGLKLDLASFTLISIAAALGVFFLVHAATRVPWIAAPLAILAGVTPFLIVRRARRRRFDQFEEQLPEAVDLISRALRAGHALTTGIGMVADEFAGPLGPEFRVLYDEQNFGLTLQQAMHNFARRVPTLDARFFVTAVLTQREAGGNLAEVLDNLASVIRDRFRIKRQIRVISTHGRLTGWILALLPPSLAVAFFAISPNHMQTLIGDPIGVRMIIAAIALQIIGTLFIRRIVNVEY